MKAEEFRGMEVGVLEEELDRRRRRLLELRCQVALGEEDRPHQIAEVRREAARIATVLVEKRAATFAGLDQPGLAALREELKAELAELHARAARGEEAPPREFKALRKRLAKVKSALRGTAAGPVRQASAPGGSE